MIPLLTHLSFRRTIPLTEYKIRQESMTVSYVFLGFLGKTTGYLSSVLFPILWFLLWRGGGEYMSSFLGRSKIFSCQQNSYFLAGAFYFILLIRFDTCWELLQFSLLKKDTNSDKICMYKYICRQYTIQGERGVCFSCKASFCKCIYTCCR